MRGHHPKRRSKIKRIPPPSSLQSSSLSSKRDSNKSKRDCAALPQIPPVAILLRTAVVVLDVAVAVADFVVDVATTDSLFTQN